LKASAEFRADPRAVVNGKGFKPIHERLVEWATAWTSSAKLVRRV